MLRSILIFTLIVIIISGCEQKKIAQLQAEKPIKQNSFFPVTQYLLGQLNELESLPVTPLKIISINGTKDSIWIKRDEIRAFAQPFINPVIDSASLYNYFSERSFLDQTINAITFAYDPIIQLPDSMQIKRWDVYVDPDKSAVKRVYIIKQLNNSTSQQTIQLTWKAGYYCNITTITEKAGTAPRIKEEKLIWNFNE